MSSTTDPRFGTLMFNPKVPWYEGASTWLNAPVKLYLDVPTEADLPGVLPHANRLWDEQAAWDARMRPRMVTELLDLWNETWRDGEPELTADAFLDRVSIKSVTVRPDGSFTIYFNDDDLFGGHSIEVRGSFDDDITDVDLAG